MSTEPTGRRAVAATGRAGARRRRRGRAFVASFALVVGVLAVLGTAGAAAVTAQGPHVTGVQVDPAAAVEASGSRLIVTMSQALREVDPEQVTVEPDVPFAVDTSGRAVGVRFGLPLFDDTEYTVTFRDVEGLGGGPSATFTETFRTPPAVVYVMQRDADGDDTILRTDLTGTEAVPVFRHEHIEDFRATSSHLVVSVREDDEARIIVSDLDGGSRRELPLPGAGFVTNLQSADRGDRIGYTFSDADLGEDGGLESVLFTASLRDVDAAPVPVEIAGVDPRVAQWQFVPDTDSVLLLSFDGALMLADPAGQTATALGDAVALDGVAGTDAIVERLTGVEIVDLTDGTALPLAGADGEAIVGGILPAPGGARQQAGGLGRSPSGPGTIRTVTAVDAQGMPTTTRIVFATDAGAESTLFEVDPSDSVIQTCVAPSGRYLAVVLAPDIVSNPYDRYELPLPERLETRIVEIADAQELVALEGSAISWCRVPPR